LFDVDTKLMRATFPAFVNVMPVPNVNAPPDPSPTLSAVVEFTNVNVPVYELSTNTDRHADPAAVVHGLFVAPVPIPHRQSSPASGPDAGANPVAWSTQFDAVANVAVVPFQFSVRPDAPATTGYQRPVSASSHPGRPRRRRRMSSTSSPP
jgi:hypothetical protein